MTTHATVDHQVALANEITAILRERIGYHEQFAAPIAEAIVSGLAARRGGDVLYVPTGNRKPRQLTERNAAIRAEFNGRNRKQLCEKWGISKARLYQIVGESKQSSAPPEQLDTCPGTLR